MLVSGIDPPVSVKVIGIIECLVVDLVVPSHGKKHERGSRLHHKRRSNTIILHGCCPRERQKTGQDEYQRDKP
jgi:hypothetical protein